MYEFLSMIIVLIGAHLIADYPLQGDAIAIGKNRTIDPARFGVPWYYWMASHAATHGMAVGLVTSSVWLGLTEAVAHFGIDVGKCEKFYGLHTDQILHVLCKAAIAIVATTSL